MYCDLKIDKQFDENKIKLKIKKVKNSFKLKNDVREIKTNNKSTIKVIAYKHCTKDKNKSRIYNKNKKLKL